MQFRCVLSFSTGETVAYHVAKRNCSDGLRGNGWRSQHLATDGRERGAQERAAALSGGVQAITRG